MLFGHILCRMRPCEHSILSVVTGVSTLLILPYGLIYFSISAIFVSASSLNRFTIGPYWPYWQPQDRKPWAPSTTCWRKPGGCDHGWLNGDGVSEIRGSLAASVPSRWSRDYETIKDNKKIIKLSQAIHLYLLYGSLWANMATVHPSETNLPGGFLDRGTGRWHLPCWALERIRGHHRNMHQWDDRLSLKHISAIHSNRSTS